MTAHGDGLRSAGVDLTWGGFSLVWRRTNLCLSAANREDSPILKSLQFIIVMNNLGALLKIRKFVPLS